MIKLFKGNSKELEAIKKMNGKVTRTEPTQKAIANYGKSYNKLIETVGGVA
ncbi:hypothetical protein ACFPYJ_01630 [Paenibacillus solisilvae]|uniref:Uncharacterized protein n=1 Tax=Paenibacillus solisilvae TaxID=2486751 RepID=A0ABW0VPM0_9BACL